MLTDTRMSRARLYVLIDAFESDMRTILEKYVVAEIGEQSALGPDFDSADQLRSGDAGDEPVSIVHYLHLRQCHDILNRNKGELPEELAEEIRSNTPNVGSLVPIRNRVMHGRPLRSDDPEDAISCLSGFTSRHWVQAKETIQRLAMDPAWEPAFEILDPPSERVLHNLPPADYDETGLIGRSLDVKRIIEMIKGPRDDIITITGEGGIGKTALALDVAYSLVDDPDPSFECVLWVSLKREVLTAYGVRDITNAFKDLTEATEGLGKVFDTSFRGSARDLAEVLHGVDTLLIVDNLESAQGTEVVALYDALPSSVSYLFTSRLGIGEIERRYPLGPLSSKSAKQLFRKFASRRSQKRLAGLNEEAIETVVVEQLRSSPLAIRWYVLSVEAGKEPILTLRNQKELLDFCVRNVYDALSDESRTVLSILNTLDHSVSFSELSVLTDLTIDNLRSAIREVSRGSLVVHEADPSGELAGRLTVSPTARMFMPIHAGDAQSATAIMRREHEYLRAVERRRSEEASGRALEPNVVRVRGPEDEPAAHFLRRALWASKKGEVEQAQQYIDRARELDPDFWECDRVDAFIASTQKRRDRAVAHYRSALSRVSSNEERAVVCHFFSGHLAREMHESELALPYAQEAYELMGSVETALNYGNLLVWNGKFAEGQEILETAEGDASGRAKMIALNSIVESWRRWGESLLDARQPVEAFAKMLAGFSVGSGAIAREFLDLRLASATLESAIGAFRAASQPGMKVEDLEDSLLFILRGIATERRFYRSTQAWQKLEANLGRWVHDSDAPGTIRTSSEKILTPDPQVRAESAPEGDAVGDADSRWVGEVISWNGRYGFIRHPEYPNNVYFNNRSLVDPRVGSLRRLKFSTVYFDVECGRDGREHAARVALVDQPH